MRLPKRKEDAYLVERKKQSVTIDAVAKPHWGRMEAVMIGRMKPKQSGTTGWPHTLFPSGSNQRASFDLKTLSSSNVIKKFSLV